MILWASMFLSTFLALHYGSPAGFKEHYAHVEADKRAVKVVAFTLLSIGCALRILDHG